MNNYSLLYIQKSKLHKTFMYLLVIIDESTPVDGVTSYKTMGSRCCTDYRLRAESLLLIF